MKIVAIDRFKIHKKEVFAYQEEQPDPVAQLAFDIIKQHAMVSAMPDGEDTSGRQKLRLPTPDEFVRRAFNIAETAFCEAMERGLLVKTPDLSEIIDTRDGTDD